MSDFADCPCCDLPTLDTRGASEICPVCWWEDAETPAPEADGPDSPLARARANFADHFDSHDPGKGPPVVATPSPERKAILAWLRAVKTGERPRDARTLHGLLRNEARTR